MRKRDSLQTQPVFSKDFSHVVYLFLSKKIYEASTDNLCYETELFTVCHFLVKPTAFFVLIKAISFSILFIFQISAMRLFIFMSFSSLEMYKYNLNINKMWLLRQLLFSKMESLFLESKNLKMAVGGVKVGKIKLFLKHWSNSDHKHLTQSHCFVV